MQPGSEPTLEQGDRRRVHPPIVPRRILSVALVVLVVVHLLPVPGDPARVVAGFLPWDLAWHLGWMLAAAVVVIYMTGPPWPDEPPPLRMPPAITGRQATSPVPPKGGPRQPPPTAGAPDA